MFSYWNDVTAGYTELVSSNKKEEGKCTFTVAAFDTYYELLEDFTDIKDVKETLDIKPRGMTALLDSMGKLITSVGKKLANMKESERPAKVLVIIQTDGEENSSKEYTREAIKKMIDEQTNVYKWQFQFIGASMESINEARHLGINVNCTSTYNPNKYLDTYTVLSEKLKNARSAETYDVFCNSVTFTDSDKEKMNDESVTKTNV